MVARVIGHPRWAWGSGTKRDRLLPAMGHQQALGIVGIHVDTLLIADTCRLRVSQCTKVLPGLGVRVYHAHGSWLGGVCWDGNADQVAVLGALFPAGAGFTGAASEDEREN